MKKTPWFQARAVRFAGLVLVILAGLIQSISAQVTIEIVNDSGLADSNVLVKVPGYYVPGHPDITMTPASLFVDLSNSIPPNPTSVPLSILATNGSAAPYQIVSSISGNTDTVYSVLVDFINSGAIYFTYNQPFSFTNKSTPSPPPDSVGNGYRYDYAEFTINDSNAQYNAVDVTYVDKFGIPLQMEWFEGTKVKAGSYVYASTKSLVDDFTTNGLGQAVFALNAGNITPGWQYTGADSYTNFARILAPQKISGTGTSVSPYPNIAGYLNSLSGSSNAFWLNGASPQGGYYYVGYQVSISTNSNGWLATLSPAPNPPPFDTELITGIEYTNMITFEITNSNASQFVYGAPVGPNLYSTNGTVVTNTTGSSYPVEVWMIGDVLSAINFGFWGGNYGTNSADWFSPVQWTSFPFGSARATDDGYYNPYAALIYNAADPYSFAFSERITPDVLMNPGNGDRVRITLLPDDRLDSPIVPTPSVSMITSNSITLNWQPVSTATGYQVNVLRPLNISPLSLPASTTSYTFTGLQTGTPYVMSVQATGTGAHGNPVITPARSISATTAGTTPATNGTLAQIQVTFSAADPYYQLAKVYINGIELLPADGEWLTTNSVPARWIAPAGTNQAVVTVIGANNEVLFNDWLTFNLAQPFTVTNGTVITTNSAISKVFLYGQKLSEPPPPVSGFLNGTTATNFLVSTQDPSLTLGLTYVPVETCKYAPLKTSASTIKILNVASLPGGGIQFTFDVPAGVPYSVETSGNLNLLNWKTNFSGIGVAGGESYTNASGTNAVQFYRIKL